jgi:hypothetical protein
MYSHDHGAMQHYNVSLQCSSATSLIWTHADRCRRRRESDSQKVRLSVGVFVFVCLFLFACFFCLFCLFFLFACVCVCVCVCTSLIWMRADRNRRRRLTRNMHTCETCYTRNEILRMQIHNNRARSHFPGDVCKDRRQRRRCVHQDGLTATLTFNSNNATLQRKQ